MDFSLPAPHRKATFRSLYSELALHKAALKAYTKPMFSWRKALSTSHDGRTLYDFARHTPQNLQRLHDLLRRQEFHFREGIAQHFNFNGKRRTIFLFPWEERIVDLLLYQGLSRHFHAAFSPHSYAYRFRGFGVDDCQHRIARQLAALPRPVYFLKRDIANYFPSIDHAVLLQALEEWIDPGDYLFDLVRERIKFQVRTSNGTETATRGVAFGTAVACFLANFYLVPLDRALESLPGIHYFRYADDFLLFTSDRNEAVEAGRRIDEVLSSLKLASKPGHHLDFCFPAGGELDPLFESAQKFRHLGLEFRANGSVGLSRDKGRKIRNLFRFAFRRAARRLRAARLPERRALLAVDLARKLVENGFRSVAIIDYYLKHVDDEAQLELLDRWLAEEILAITFQNGHRKGNFKKISFGRLRAMGLPSLVHRRRLLRHGHLESSFFVLRNTRLIEQVRGRLSPGARRKRQAGFPPGLEAATQKSR